MASKPSIRHLSEAERYAPDLDDDGNLDPETFPIPTAEGIDDPYLQQVWQAAVEGLDQGEEEMPVAKTYQPQLGPTRLQKGLPLGKGWSTRVPRHQLSYDLVQEFRQMLNRLWQYGIRTPTLSDEQIARMLEAALGVGYGLEGKSYETKDQGQSYFATCERDKEGHCLPSGQGGQQASQEQAGTKPDKKPQAKPQLAAQEALQQQEETPDAIAAEPVTAPPPETPDQPVYQPNVEEVGEQGVTKAARVGVEAMEVPPPPKIGQLPNLTEHERAVEKAFIDHYEADPDQVAQDFREVITKSTKPGEPLTFGTDDAKVLTDAWSHPDQAQRAVNRATLNLALHQTANAIAKRAFFQELDNLKEGDAIMVTVGGVGAGKGYAINSTNEETGEPNVPQAVAIKKQSKVVWDSAGDQNATENPWIQQEAEKRGLKVNYVFVHANPETQWAHPKRGVVKRAADPKDGRMVDAKVFADSYALGVRNHQAFYEANKDNPNANFTFIENGSPPKLLKGIPPEALQYDRHQLAQFAIDAVKKSDAPPHVQRGATMGERIWEDD